MDPAKLFTYTTDALQYVHTHCACQNAHTLYYTDELINLLIPTFTGPAYDPTKEYLKPEIADITANHTTAINTLKNMQHTPQCHGAEAARVVAQSLQHYLRYAQLHTNLMKSFIDYTHTVVNAEYIKYAIQDYTTVTKTPTLLTLNNTTHRNIYDVLVGSSLEMLHYIASNERTAHLDDHQCAAIMEIRSISALLRDMMRGRPGYTYVPNRPGISAETMACCGSMLSPSILHTYMKALQQCRACNLPPETRYFANTAIEQLIRVHDTGVKPEASLLYANYNTAFANVAGNPHICDTCRSLLSAISHMLNKYQYTVLQKTTVNEMLARLAVRDMFVATAYDAFRARTKNTIIEGMARHSKEAIYRVVSYRYAVVAMARCIRIRLATARVDEELNAIHNALQALWQAAHTTTLDLTNKHM